MDHHQTRTGEYPTSLVSQMATSYPQGPGQHVNLLHSQDSMYRLSHSRQTVRQQDRVDEHKDLSSNIQQHLLERSVSPSYSRFQSDSYPIAQQSSSLSSSAHHDVAQSLVKHQELSGQSHRSQDFTHRNSPLDHTKHTDLVGQAPRSQEFSRRSSPLLHTKQSLLSTQAAMVTSSSKPLEHKQLLHSSTTTQHHNQQQQQQQQQQQLMQKAVESERDHPQTPSSHSYTTCSVAMTAGHPRMERDQQEQHQQQQLMQKAVESERDLGAENFSTGNYQTESQKESELFFDHKIKKDSEIKLTKRDMEFLADVEKEAGLYRKNGKSESRKSTTSTSSDSSDSPENKAKMEATAVNQLLNLQSDKMHVCMTCFKTFKNKPQLTQHELVHNGMRKHMCIYCDKAFKQVCHLNQHTRVHTGERPYKCTMEGCERAFAQLSNLNHHMKNHEEHVRRDINKQYRCDVCDRSYANQNSLHTHIQKLHMNLKAVEGTTTNPIVVSTTPKKRKRKSKDTPTLPNMATLAAQKSTQQYSYNFSDSEDEGQSAQIQKKSVPSLKHETVIEATISQDPARDSKSQSSFGGNGPSQNVINLQRHGFPAPQKRSDLQHYSQIKIDHGLQKPLDQNIVNQRVEDELQLSQTYNRELSPPTSSKQGKIQQEVHALLQREITPSASLQREVTPSTNTDIQREVTSSASLQREITPNTNGSHVTDSNQITNNPPLPFLVQSTPSITSPPIPSNLFNSLPQMPLPKSIADTLPSHIRHHFPTLDRESRTAMHNLFNPAFSSN